MCVFRSKILYLLEFLISLFTLFLHLKGILRSWRKYCIIRFRFSADNLSLKVLVDPKKVPKIFWLSFFEQNFNFFKVFYRFFVFMRYFGIVNNHPRSSVSWLNVTLFHGFLFRLKKIFGSRLSIEFSSFQRSASCNIWQFFVWFEAIELLADIFLAL